MLLHIPEFNEIGPLRCMKIPRGHCCNACRTQTSLAPISGQLMSALRVGGQLPVLIASASADIPGDLTVLSVPGSLPELA